MTTLASAGRPAGIRPDRRDAVRLGLLALVLGGIYFIFQFFGVTDIGYIPDRATRSAFFWLYERWRMDLRETWFAHSHLVPLVSLLLVWIDRRNLAALSRRRNYLGLAVIILSLLIHWAGAKSEQTRLSILSLIGLSWGIPFFICGWPTARRLLFPCGLLIFSLPLNFFDAATYPLRILAATVSSGLLAGLGIDVNRVGSTIVNAEAGFSFDLADSRSGIFAVTAVVAFSLVAAYLTRTRLLLRAALVAASVPLVVLANILRGILIMLLASAFGDVAGQFAARFVSGPLVCAVTFGGITALALRARRRFPARDGSTPLLVRPGSSGATTSLAVTLAVVVLGAWWIPSNLDVTYIEKAGVSIEFPPRLGDWSGGPVLFCLNPADGENFSDPELNAGDPCPNCGEPLYSMTAIERKLLPADTVLKRNRYEKGEDQRVFFTVVLSGQKRSSIHRPEVCLVGPNSEIDHSFIHEVSVPGRNEPLKVKILEMVHRVRRPDGEMAMWTSYYAYWFVGMDRETPHHVQRMVWMAADRLLRDRSYRWAYISVAGRRLPGDGSYLMEIDDFLAQAYPALRPPP